ncbi:hypothetical protein DFP72DRAFT_967407 [Ephemerocybe angulata]|uniref:UBR-type domain-containing protein n=1 Tax=Ephemerocybe angulata TaxID=980116 RepID=A0A8H6HUD2_9AGAR|nr:hypothetical protein DFP72DRAFT_967407 [Tulosesus angulatus]
MAESTLSEYLESQDELVREAGLALPHQFSQCTYPLGYMRQAVYLCLTCPEPRGICSACSIACHTDHEQVELFPKRGFRCDCPTSVIAHSCTLDKAHHPENELNHYGQNFRGVFCRCSKPYDPKKEREAMIQCLVCEDWFHESCCNLRERPPSRDPTPEVQKDASENADAASDASSTDLPPPLISADDYDSFVCGGCVSKVPILKKYAGSTGAIMVARDNTDEKWRRVEKAQEDHVIVDDSEETLNTGSKRRLPSADTDVPEAKRPRGSGSTKCLSPSADPLALKVFQQNSGSELGTGDIFLTDGFRERWCHCDECEPSLEKHRYLVEEEDTYEPPPDPDSGLSLEELGMRALERLPRDRAIDGIHAFNAMRDGLKSFLQPFAQEGKVVNEADVKEFFASLTEARKKGDM